MKHANYESMNFAQFPLPSYEMLSYDEIAMRKNLPQRITSLGRKNLNCFGKQVPKCLTRKYKKYFFSNQTFFIPLNNSQLSIVILTHFAFLI